MRTLRLSYLSTAFLTTIFKESVREFFFCTFGKGEDKSNKLNAVFFFLHPYILRVPMKALVF